MEFFLVQCGADNFPYPLFDRAQIIFRIPVIIRYFFDMTLALFDSRKISVEEKVFLIGFANIKDQDDVRCPFHALKVGNRSDCLAFNRLTV
jgi:hypothetical protein